jgi:hypothetical protein
MPVYMWSYMSQPKQFWALIFQLKDYVRGFPRIDIKV